MCAFSCLTAKGRGLCASIVHATLAVLLRAMLLLQLLLAVDWTEGMLKRNEVLTPFCLVYSCRLV
jgi:hypothetical protein